MNSVQSLPSSENSNIVLKIKSAEGHKKYFVKVIYKKYHTKVFNKKLGCYVDDYPLDKYLIKNSAKIIFYTQVKENLYAIVIDQELPVCYKKVVSN